MPDVSTYVSNWEKVTAIFTAVGGLGAAAGGIAAFFAARASGQTARDARDALAASLKPQVHVVFTQKPRASQLKRAPLSSGHCRRWG